MSKKKEKKSTRAYSGRVYAMAQPIVTTIWILHVAESREARVFSVKMNVRREKERGKKVAASTFAKIFQYSPMDWK